MAPASNEAEKKDTKNINEIVDALEITVNTASEVLADGEINFSDIPSALKLVNNYDKFIKAVDNAAEAIEEAKDLDETEALELGMRMFKIIKGVAEIIKNVKK